MVSDRELQTSSSILVKNEEDQAPEVGRISLSIYQRNPSRMKNYFPPALCEGDKPSCILQLFRDLLLIRAV